jgi:uncharacterized protein
MNYMFEWDVDKANTNFKKHKVRFEFAASIFQDPMALTIFDDEHSDTEDRWITIGLARNSHLLLVVHTYYVQNMDDVIIRIISARKATKNETKMYKGEI